MKHGTVTVSPAPPAFVSDEEEEYQMRIMREAARAIGSPLDGSSFAERQYATRKALLDAIDRMFLFDELTIRDIPTPVLTRIDELRALAASVRSGK